MKGRRPPRIEPTIGGLGSIPVDDETTGADLRNSPVEALQITINPADRPFFREKKRPFWLSVAAVVLVVSGLSLLGIQFLEFNNFLNAFNAIGISALSGVGQVFVLGVLYIIAGVDIWEGKKWGWILAVAALVHGVVTSLQGLVFASMLDMPVALSSGASISPYAKFGLKALLHVGVIFYFFRTPVIEFFEIAKLSAFKYFGWVVSILIGLFVVLSLFG